MRPSHRTEKRDVLLFFIFRIIWFSFSGGELMPVVTLLHHRTNHRGLCGRRRVWANASMIIAGPLAKIFTVGGWLGEWAFCLYGSRGDLAQHDTRLNHAREKERRREGNNFFVVTWFAGVSFRGFSHSISFSLARKNGGRKRGGIPFDSRHL